MKKSNLRNFLVLIIVLMTTSSLIFPNIYGINLQTKEYTNNGIQQQIAENIAQTHILLKQKQEHFISDCNEIIDHNGNQLIYVFNLYPQGYIVVASNKNLPPIIAYSFENDFGRISEDNVLLKILKADISDRINHCNKISEQVLTERSDLWNNYISGSIINIPKPVGATIGPLLDTKWSQNAPYNNFCPIDLGSGTRSVAGCPAVAMAQILNYHRTTRNTQFDDGDDYYHNYGGNRYWIDDDYETYDFPSFPELNSYLQTLEEHYEDEVPLTNDDKAALNFACGVAAKQVYNPGGSGTFGVNQAYNSYLRFSLDNIELLDEDDPDIYNRMQENILEGLPVHIAVVNEGWTAGHNMVVDGYDNGFYHINFGWGGPHDGWYDVPDEIPYELTVIEGIIVDINKENPQSDLDGDGLLGWTDVKTGSTVTGSFTIKNTGEPGSSIDWEIISYPEWGTWTFTPESGQQLKPEDGDITIEVSVIAPDEKDQEFAGYVKVVNVDNNSDFCLIHAALTTPRIKNLVRIQYAFQDNLFQILLKLILGKYDI
jgi:hypothetical protein